MLRRPVPVTAGGASRQRTKALVAMAMAIAGASLLASQSLRFDPQGWLRWGREIGLGQGHFDTSGYPSWKPLPLVVAVPLAATGSAAPLLWLFGVRTAGLLALTLVYRLTERHAGVLAGGIAAVLLALAPGWWPTLLGGGIEPVVVALGAAAVAAQRADRPDIALGCLVAMALGREEAILLLGAYGLYLSRRDRRWIVPACGAVAAVVGAWLGGDWLGSGDALHGGELARTAAVAPRHLDDPALVAIGPVALVLWAAGLVGSWRARDRSALAIAAAGIAWAVCDLALLAAGYPLPARFLLPAAAASAAIAGVGGAVLRERA